MHNQFYQFVAEQLAENPAPETFPMAISQKLAEILHQVKKHEGRDGLQCYLIELNYLADNPLDLDLFPSFKNDE